MTLTVYTFEGRTVKQRKRVLLDLKNELHAFEFRISFMIKLI